jgi:hypothetical protein
MARVPPLPLARELRNDALRQDFAEFHAALIEGIDNK